MAYDIAAAIAKTTIKAVSEGIHHVEAGSCNFSILNSFSPNVMSVFPTRYATCGLRLPRCPGNVAIGPQFRPTAISFKKKSPALAGLSFWTKGLSSIDRGGTASEGNRNPLCGGATLYLMGVVSIGGGSSVTETCWE